MARFPPFPSAHTARHPTKFSAGCVAPFEMPKDQRHHCWSKCNLNQFISGDHCIGFSISSRNLEPKKSTLQQRKFRLYAAVEHANVGEPEDFNSKDWRNSASKKLNAIYVFTRPYALKATILSAITISLLPVETMADLSLFLMGLVKGLVPVTLMHIYSVGLNQVYDIEIDKVDLSILEDLCCFLIHSTLVKSHRS
ncbi:coumarin 8-geranyltransferase 1, chloroplastic-like [Tasmannia lanceolata]|uniref:coumarin 8-geranyltransferase 1, chloroplastic-like n=1 Tax=Tasmannia lanceolata TaxID=3420 RepID=UPI0040633979